MIILTFYMKSLVLDRRTRMLNTLPSVILLLVSTTIKQTTAEIIKPLGEWICNYCAMGKYLTIQNIYQLLRKKPLHFREGVKCKNRKKWS